MDRQNNPFDMPKAVLYNICSKVPWNNPIKCERKEKMKLRKLFCIAAILCLLCSVAAADRPGNFSYAVPVNIIRSSVRPYDWESQEYRNGRIATHIDSALDGNCSTAMWFGCYSNAATDDIPDITFYFDNATIKDIWIRNGSEKSDNFRDYARMGNLAVTIWSGDRSYGLYFPRKGRYNKFYNLQDNYDADELSENFIDGYQRYALDNTYYNVTKIEFWVKGWYEGEKKDNQHRYQMWIADIAFLSDSLVNLYGPGVFDSSYGIRMPSQNWVSTTTAAPQINSSSGFARTNRQDVRVREYPDKTSALKQLISKSGSFVELVSRTTGNDGRLWYYVNTEDGINGYIREDFLTVQRQPGS